MNSCFWNQRSYSSGVKKYKKYNLRIFLKNIQFFYKWHYFYNVTALKVQRKGLATETEETFSNRMFSYFGSTIYHQNFIHWHEWKTKNCWTWVAVFYICILRGFGISLLDNAPNYLVGGIIQKRFFWPLPPQFCQCMTTIANERTTLLTDKMNQTWLA